jgi:hypothetical protein
MEVVVHGTKGGYRILYKTQGAPSIASDIRNNASSETSLGKSVYAISFVTNGSVFSKYMIVKDTLRSSATGFIAFSIFLPAGEKLTGVDVKSLLDQLQSHYVDTYIKTNQMNRGERIQIIQEEWAFINEILSKYTTSKNFSQNQLKSGTKEAAFIYYNGDGELIEYLDKPFQEEFFDYKQVLLINSALQGNSDLLNVLRNSGSEIGTIDLKNKYYYLSNYNSSKDLTIKANGKPLPVGKNNNVIRANDKVEIKYNKDDRFYLPKEASGTLSNSSSEIHKYFDINGNQIIINHDAFKNPDCKTKVISLEIKDRNGSPIYDAVITCKNYEGKTVNDNQIIFSGEDLGKSWKVSATKGENLFLDNHPIDFQRDCPEDNGTISLQLNERKKVRFSGRLDNFSIADIKVTIEQKNKYQVNPEVEFLNQEIENTFTVTATHQKGSENFSGKNSFSPKDNDTVYIDLHTEKVKKYIIDNGKHGKKTENCPSYSHDKQGTDAKSFIKSKRGWKFTGFKLEEGLENSGYDGKLVAQYKRDYKPIIVASLFLSVLIVSAGLYGFWPKENNQRVLLAEYEIEQYVEGIELNVDTLNNYKTKWENQNSEIIEDRNFVWYKPITWIKSEEQTRASIEEHNWKKASGWIDIATKKRNTIDQLDFKLLKDGTRYSKNQQTFKLAIMGVDSTQYDAIQERFKDVSKWNLNQIADSIKVFINPKVIENNESKEPSTSESHSNKVKKNNVETNKENKTEQPPKKETGNGKKTSEIKRDIQSSTITIAQLEKYKQEHPADLSNTIDLYLQFWKLVKDNNNQKNDFDSLLGDIKQDKTLKNSELKKFLDSICAGSKAFEKYLKVTPRPLIKNIKEFNVKYKEQ